jgi:molybdopterin-guanine dinucleotide biosynthesis protein A
LKAAAMRTEGEARGAARRGPLDGARGAPEPTPRDLVTGAVLCGGASRRMGAGIDKARLSIGGRLLIVRAAETLATVAGRVLLASGPAPRYPELGYDVVLDPVAGGSGVGPLGGLVAALEACRTEWLAVLACDMPRADARVFERLLAEAGRRRLDACLLETAGGPEPLLAVYRAATHAGLAIGTLREEALGPELARADCARNLNTPEDLARELAARAGTSAEPRPEERP